MKRTLLIGLISSLTLFGCGAGSVGEGASYGAEPGSQDNPGASVPTPPTPAPPTETCNGFDDNLDGRVDEGCACSPGKTQKCFLGHPSQLKGICRAGQQTCAGQGTEFGAWGPCEGAVAPQPEICGDGIDQDCDGADLRCPPSGQPKPPGPLPQQRCEDFTFGKNSRPVDIIFAIDQSGSMGDDIDKVRAHMNAFAAAIAGGKADYRVVLVASRLFDPDNHQICIPQPLAGPACADAARFKQIDQHVDSHDALVQLMAHAGGYEPFLRKDSQRHFVVVTDDTSKLAWPIFDAFFKGRPGYQDYVFHSVVGFKDGGCSQDKGKNYMALSTLTGGLIFDLCKASWAVLFAALSKNVVSVTSKFKLSQKPKANTLQVTYDGQPAQPGAQWLHDPLINQLVLRGALPRDGAKIRACYQT